jgi:glycosyltransferase involved in cell wall biosynthesis
MNQPLFSVVIPTYNRAKFIEETLKSVFEQNYRNYEVIVVDNCSTDNTIEVLQKYVSQKKITLIVNERNYERAHSRNVGMKSAQGDFLTFLDSDDFMYESCLSDAAKFIEENPAAKCFHNLYELVDSSKTPIRQYYFPPLTNQIKSIVNGNFMSCIGDFIHRDIYTKYNFDAFPNLTGVEDWEFWLRVLADHKVSRIEKINNGVLQHETRSINMQNVEHLSIGITYLIKKFRSDEHLSTVYAPYLDRLEANLSLYLAILSNTGGLFDEARHHLKSALKTDFSVALTMKFIKILRRAVFKLKIETS